MAKSKKVAKKKRGRAKKKKELSPVDMRTDYSGYNKPLELDRGYRLLAANILSQAFKDAFKPIVAKDKIMRRIANRDKDDAILFLQQGTPLRKAILKYWCRVLDIHPDAITEAYRKKENKSFEVSV